MEKVDDIRRESNFSRTEVGIGISFIDELDLPSLIPMVEKFVKITDVTLSQCLYEITASFYTDKYFTIVAKKEGKIVAYFVGCYLTTKDVMLTQAMSTDPLATKTFDKFISSYLSSRGIVRILFHTKLPPEVFKKYGYRLERYALVKNLKEVK